MLPFIGMGYDVHAFAKDRPLIMGGITIPHDKGLAGHSDADVVVHALCDAIYGALGEGDIGRHFPPSDNQWKGKDSLFFLEHAAKLISEYKGKFVNCDITIICEEPKITPHAQKMMDKLAGYLNVPAKRISIKATTTECLGFTGRKEGIAAVACVSIMLPEEHS